MEMEKMIELIDAVSKSDLTGFKYEEDGIKLHLSKKENTCYVTENVSAPVNMTGTASDGVVSAEMGKTNAEGDQTLGAAAEEAVAGNIVESPLVGTFYSAPAEDAESLMRLGDTPVPIPNTTVKTQSADGTALETVWESRWAPDQKENNRLEA